MEQGGWQRGAKQTSRARSEKAEFLERSFADFAGCCCHMPLQLALLHMQTL